MKWGGLVYYSKYEALKHVPSSFKPKEQLINSSAINFSEIKYPFVIKPDEGERGKAVELIKNEQELSDYLRASTGDLMIQSFINLPYEFGLFYARLPSEKQGQILSITAKSFLTFKGDGIKSLREFINEDIRASSRKEYLYQKYSSRLDQVLSKGEELLLEPIGNHNRGTIFLDGSHLICPKLTETLDEIAKQIPGFFYGRFDVKAQSEEALQNGEFIILEVNGANSEATHIYHPGKFNLFQAYREVKRHLKMQYRIAKENREKGIKPPKTLDFVQMIGRANKM